MDKVTGHPLFLDVSRIFPGGDIADVVPNVKGAIPLPQPLTPSHPILTMLSGLLANRDLWTGKDLVDLNDTTMESTANRTAWIWRNLSSGLAIGSANWERGMQAVAQASGGEIKFLPDWAGGAATGIGKDGLPVQPGLAALQTIGIKIRPVNLGLSERIDQNERRKLIQGIEAELRSLARQRSLGAITDRQFEKEKDKGVAKIQNLAQGLTVGGDEKP